MKKHYIEPNTEIHELAISYTICAGSIEGTVGGDSGVTGGGDEPDTPTGGDSRGGFWDED